SWAARADSDVAIWSIRMEPGALWTLPPAQAGSNRTLYFFRGSSLQVGDRALSRTCGIALSPSAAVSLTAGGDPVELLVLQGRPIGEPVVQHGPFVMTTRSEI